MWGVASEMLASLFLIGASWSLPQGAPPLMTSQPASQAIVEDGPDGLTRAANRMTGGIISYVRWPDGQSGARRTLCVIGAPRLTRQVAPIVPSGPPVTVRPVAAADVGGGESCDILFLGRLSDSDRQRWIGWVRDRAVLTITDDDPACVRGAMFCLAPRQKGLGFSVNLDAIGRGGLRVDPRVLKIGQSDEDAA